MPGKQPGWSPGGRKRWDLKVGRTAICMERPFVEKDLRLRLEAVEGYVVYTTGATIESAPLLVKGKRPRLPGNQSSGVGDLLLTAAS
jgi:hypothetical protein